MPLLGLRDNGAYRDQSIILVGVSDEMRSIVGILQFSKVKSRDMKIQMLSVSLHKWCILRIALANTTEYPDWTQDVRPPAP